MRSDSRGAHSRLVVDRGVPRRGAPPTLTGDARPQAHVALRARGRRFSFSEVLLFKPTRLRMHPGEQVLIAWQVVRLLSRARQTALVTEIHRCWAHDNFFSKIRTLQRFRNGVAGQHPVYLASQNRTCAERARIFEPNALRHALSEAKPRIPLTGRVTLKSPRPLFFGFAVTPAPTPSVRCRCGWRAAPCGSRPQTAARRCAR